MVVPVLLPTFEIRVDFLQPFVRHLGTFFDVLCTLKQLKISKSVTALDVVVYLVVGDASRPKTMPSEPCCREDVVNVELFGMYLNERE